MASASFVTSSFLLPLIPVGVVATRGAGEDVWWEWGEAPRERADVAAAPRPPLVTLEGDDIPVAFGDVAGFRAVEDALLLAPPPAATPLRSMLFVFFAVDEKVLERPPPPPPPPPAVTRSGGVPATAEAFPVVPLPPFKAEYVNLGGLLAL